MQWREINRPVVSASLGLAVEGNHITGKFEADGIDPRHKGLLKGSRIQTGKHPAKGIVTRNAVWQVKKLAKESLFGTPVGFDIQPAIGVTNDSANRDRDDVEEQMVLTAIDARVGQIIKMALNTGDERHRRQFPFRVNRSIWGTIVTQRALV